jgi:hypothetical protein
MNKFLPAFYVVSIALTLSAYNIQNPTTSVTVTGKVKKPQTFQLADLQKFSMKEIGDVVISNHKGEAKGTAKSMKGILLRDVLESIPLDTDNPKLFSEYYFVCKAADGYKVVYSWNELFNTATGNSTYVVLEKDGKPMAGDGDHVLMVSSQDSRTGRRFVKNLETIYVGRAE